MQVIEALYLKDEELVARRRLQCRRALKINPPFTVLVAVVGIVSGAISHHWVGVVLGVLLIGSAAAARSWIEVSCFARHS